MSAESMSQWTIEACQGFYLKTRWKTEFMLQRGKLLMSLLSFMSD